VPISHSHQQQQKNNIKQRILMVADKRILKRILTTLSGTFEIHHNHLMFHVLDFESNKHINKIEK
jgi:hypothetical protein